MRILTRRIYRAFPELDPYPDERCERFIHAAQRSWVRRVIDWALALAASGAVLAAGWLVLMLLGHLSPGIGEVPFALVVTILLVTLAAAPVVGALARDQLLRRRVRHVLRARGLCAACRYTLVGLPVSEANTVTCPECALECEVDPAMGELVGSEGGRPRFQPAPPRVPRFFTPARVRRIRRATIWGAAALTLAAAAGFGGYEIFLRYQASVARAERPGVEAITALVEAHQPPGSEGGANAWYFLEDALARADRAELADAGANPVDPLGNVYPDFDLIYSPPAEGDPSRAEYRAASEEYARRLLDVYREHGVYDALDRMAAAPRAVRRAFAPAGSRLDVQFVVRLSELRRFVRVNAARMALAQERGDLREYISALEASLALARIGYHQPSVTGSYVAIAGEAHAYWRLYELLLAHPDAEWLDAIDAAIARQRADVPLDYVLECERLITLDRIAWVFSDPAMVRWGNWSRVVRAMRTDYGYRPGRLGTYRGNRDALNAGFKARSVRSDDWDWQASGSEATGFILVDAWGWARRYAWSFDQVERTRRAYTVMSALERHRIDSGAYPPSLDALVPSYLGAVPPDPISRASWGYRLRARDADPADPRGYILYSFGPDATDNGGRRDAFNRPASGRGYDHVLNDWRPPEVE